MSLSLTDDLRDTEKPAEIATGKFIMADAYLPHVEAYAPEAKNDRHQQLRAALNSDRPPTLTLSTIAYDGQRERVDLSSPQAKLYLESGLPERRRLAMGLIREQRWNVARKAAEAIRSGKVDLVENLPPYEQACLREFDAIETRRKKTIREGKTTFPVVECIREDFWNGLGGDNENTVPGGPGTQGYLDQEFLNYSGPLGQQLLLNDVWDQAAKCFWAWHHDPVAQEACNIIRNFVVARGVTIDAADQRVQALIDAFDHRMGMRDRLKTWTVGLSRDGELFIRIFKPGDGTVRVRSLDPSTIWEIVTDAEDIESVYYYAQRYQTRTQLYAPPDGSDAQHWVERDLTADEVIHIKVNVAESEVRGRSDLFSVLPYLKMLRDLFATVVLKEQAQAAYQYDFTVNGSSADVNNFVATGLPTGKPQPGSFFAHNQAVAVKMLESGKSTATANGSSWEGLLTMIAIGIGVAKDYLGVTSRGSRATALVATEPSAMRFEERQDTIGTALDRLYREVIDEARRFGKLDGVEDFSFTITFPSIEKSDAADQIDLINTGVGMGYLSHETAAGLYYAEMDMDDGDYEAEQLLIAAEMEREHPPLILAKYATIPMGDASTGALGAEPDDPPANADAPIAPGMPPKGGDAPGKPRSGGAQGADTRSPSSDGGASAIRRDLGPHNRESLASHQSVAERWRLY